MNYAGMPIITSHLVEQRMAFVMLGRNAHCVVMNLTDFNNTLKWPNGRPPFWTRNMAGVREAARDRRLYR